MEGIDNAVLGRITFEPQQTNTPEVVALFLGFIPLFDVVWPVAVMDVTIPCEIFERSLIQLRLFQERFDIGGRVFINSPDLVKICLRVTVDRDGVVTRMRVFHI